MRRSKCLACCLIGWLNAIGSVNALAPTARYSAPELRVRLGQVRRKLVSLYVVYRSEHGFYDGNEAAVEGGYLFKIVCAHADGHLYHVKAHGHDRLDWQDDPWQQRCYVTTPHWYVENAVNRAYSQGTVGADDELPGTLNQELFFLATGMWPFSRRPAPRLRGEPYMIRDVAECEEYCFVRPHQEKIDGRWCHVLERPGTDRLWIDVDRGMAVVARETRDPNSGVLVQRYELSDHQEVAQGIWLPGRIRNIQYDYLARTPEARKRKVIDARFKLLERRANCVDSRIFEFRAEPGAILIADATPWQIKAGGLDHLDATVTWLQRQLPRYARASPRNEWILFYGSSGCVILTIIAVRCWQHRHKRSLTAPRPG